MFVCVLTLSACGDGGASQAIHNTAPGNTEINSATETQETKEAHTHAFGAWTVITEAGCLTKGEEERSCACGEKEKKEIAALGHREVTDAATASTCIVAGKTEGKHCSRCNHIIVEQTALPLANHTYENAQDEKCNVCNFVRDIACQHTQTSILPAIAATCTTGGLTEGKKCASCQETLVAQATVDPRGHHEVVDPAEAPTCSAPGKTEGKHCSVCRAVLVPQETVAKLSHTLVTDAAVAATCSAPGKTEGKHCSVCGEVTVPQEAVAKLPHTEAIDAAVAATCTASGKTQGKHCSVCGEVTVPQEIVAKLPHTEVIDAAVAVTCTTDGKTEGKHCSVCGEVLVKQTAIKAQGHIFSELRVEMPGWDTPGARALACKNCTEAQSDSIRPMSQSLYGYQEFGTHAKGSALQSVYRELYVICDRFAQSRENETDGVIGVVNLTGTGLTAEEAISVYFTFFEENGQFYWLSNTLTVEETHFNVCIAEDYYSASQRSKFDEDIASMIRKTAARITKDMGDLERALVLHDYILGEINYAYVAGTSTPENAPWAHSIVGVSSKGKGVCESYAKTFVLLCRLNGVECIPVWGDAGGAHMWNLVKINGAWYFVDLTWDDLNVDQAHRLLYFGMSQSRSSVERTVYSNVYGAEYCYPMPTVSTTDLQAVELFQNGASKGVYFGLDKAFAAMTQQNADYVLDLMLDYYVVPSSTPNVKSLTVNGNLYVWGEEQWIETSWLVFDRDVKLNGNLTVNNITFVAQKSSRTLDLNGKTLTTGGHYCKAEWLLTLAESGNTYEYYVVHVTSGTKTAPTGKLVIRTAYQTELYSDLCVETVEGNGGNSNELALRGNAVIGNVKNLGTLRCVPYYDACQISIGSLECYNSYFCDGDSSTVSVTVGTVRYLKYPTLDESYLNSVLIDACASFKVMGSIEYYLHLIVECGTPQELVGKTLLSLGDPNWMNKLLIESLTYSEQANITDRCTVDASGNVIYVG